MINWGVVQSDSLSTLNRTAVTWNIPLIHMPGLGTQPRYKTPEDLLIKFAILEVCNRFDDFISLMASLQQDTFLYHDLYHGFAVCLC